MSAINNEELTPQKETRTKTPPSPIYVSVADFSAFYLWLGFSTMEQLTFEEGLESLYTREIVSNMIMRGVPKNEAEEALSAVSSFPRVPRILYSHTRSDYIPSQHYTSHKFPLTFLQMR